MKRGILSLLLAAALLVSCSGVKTADETEAVTEVYTGKAYSHEERLALLDDTALELPSSFYETEAKENYFRLLNIIRDEYTNPGTVADEYFAEFEEAKSNLACSYTGDYPVIVINAPVNLNRDNYQTGNVTVIDGDKVLAGEVQIKIRGNSTSGAPKKPYNIKFSEKVSLFGMEEGKKWSLLANMFDKTLIRNKLAFDFASELRLDYVSQSEFCEVWVNGVFMGNYLACEPISDGANRVGVDTSAYDFILEITPFGGWSFVTGAGVPILYDSPENPSNEQKKYLSELLASTENAMETGDIAEYSKYIDVDSFVDLYILQELFKDVDGYWKSLYFYVKDGILYAGPPWDYDLTCGNVSTTYKEDNYYNYHNSHGCGDKSNDSTHGLRMDEGWWAILLDTKEFASLVRERYEELQPLIKNIYEDNDKGTNRIDVLEELNGKSFEREYSGSGTELNAGWDISESYSIYAGESKGSYEDNVDYLRKWLEQRNEWLLENIGK